MGDSVISGARAHNAGHVSSVVDRVAHRGLTDAGPRGAAPSAGVALALLLLVSVVVPFATGTAPATALTPTAPLAISQFVASPSNFVISNQTWLNVTVTGGTPPYTYSYAGLPASCHSANVSSLDCLPNEVSTFNVTVNVHDTNGSTASSWVVFTVTSGYKGPPVISSVVITPNPVALGHVTQIQVNAVSVSGSTLTFFYFDLPPGCYSFNQTPLQCLPSVPGTYEIGIQVTDAFGQPVQYHTSLTVTGSLPTKSSTSPVSNYALYGVPVAVVVVALVIGIFLLGRRRRREPPKPFVEPPKP